MRSRHEEEEERHHAEERHQVRKTRHAHKTEHAHETEHAPKEEKPMTPAPDTTTQPQQPVPPGMTAVKLKKGFTHFGRPYNVGDTFIGDSVETAALVRQGYCDPPQPASGTQPGSTDPTTTQASPGY